MTNGAPNKATLVLLAMILVLLLFGVAWAAGIDQ